MSQVTTVSASAADHPVEPQEPRRGAILIVEDRDDVRQGLAQLLEFQEYVVFEACNAVEAFAHLESSPHGIALMLLDLNLPGTTGGAIRARQLADPRVAAIPIVVVSACGPDMAGSADLRAAAWVEKPFRFEQLLEEVRRFVLPERNS